MDLKEGLGLGYDLIRWIKNSHKLYARAKKDGDENLANYILATYDLMERAVKLAKDQKKK